MPIARMQLTKSRINSILETRAGYRLAAPISRKSLRTAFVIAVLMALGGVLSACGFSNTFNYGHGQGACENCGDEQ